MTDIWWRHCGVGAARLEAEVKQMKSALDTVMANKYARAAWSDG